MIGTSDQSCWLAEACKILLLLLLQQHCNIDSITASLVQCKHEVMPRPIIEVEPTHLSP